jgi:hypothetical protein
VEEEVCPDVRDYIKPELVEVILLQAHDAPESDANGDVDEACGD